MVLRRPTAGRMRSTTEKAALRLMAKREERPLASQLQPRKTSCPRSCGPGLGREAEERCSARMTSRDHARIVRVDPFARGGVAPFRRAMQLHLTRSHPAKFNLATGEFPFANQANALIVQAVPATVRVHVAQKVEPLSHWDVVAIRGLLHGYRIVFPAASVHRGTGGAFPQRKS
jgi:hypothetical protein